MSLVSNKCINSNSVVTRKGPLCNMSETELKKKSLSAKHPFSKQTSVCIEESDISRNTAKCKRSGQTE